MLPEPPRGPDDAPAAGSAWQGHGADLGAAPWHAGNLLPAGDPEALAAALGSHADTPWTAAASPPVGAGGAGWPGAGALPPAAFGYVPGASWAPTMPCAPVVGAPWPPGGFGAPFTPAQPHGTEPEWRASPDGVYRLSMTAAGGSAAAASFADSAPAGTWATPAGLPPPAVPVTTSPWDGAPPQLPPAAPAVGLGGGGRLPVAGAGT